MELQYKKTMEENNLKLSDLPEDAQTGIDNINDVLKGIAMLERKGKQPTPKTLKKIKAMDKWVYYEILDHLQGTDNNEDKMPEDSKQVLEEIKQQVDEKPQVTPEQTMGIDIENDFAKMIESGKKDYTIEEIKSLSSKAYNVLFNTYEKGAENGIKTNRFALLETQAGIFTLTKN